MNLSKTIILGTAFLSFSALSNAAHIPLFSKLREATNVVNVSGTFQDNAVLSGFLDISGGKISWANMHVSGIAGNFILDNRYDKGYSAPSFVNINIGGQEETVLENIDLHDGGNILSLALLLNLHTDDLNNYAGGALCDSSNNCGEIVSFYLPAKEQDPILSSGFASTAPEPGSTALLGGGLSALGLILRRRFVKK